MAHSYEVVSEIWDDKTGSKLEIGQDRDALELVEIRRKDECGALVESVTFNRDEAALVIRALRAVGYHPTGGQPCKTTSDESTKTRSPD